MVFIVETGAGTPNANAYTTPVFVDAYLLDENLEALNLWSTQTTTRKQQGIVAASRHIDVRWGNQVKGERFRRIVTGRQAIGTVTFTTLPVINELVTVGQLAYRLVDVLTLENDVLRGVTATESATNLAAAINSGGDDVTSDALTQVSYEAIAAASGLVLTVEAQLNGLNGNEIILTTTVTGATASGSGSLTGGLDDGPQPLIFPRRFMFGYDGLAINGIPLKLKQSVSEYAARSLAAVLAPDLTVDPTGALVQKKVEKVGPIVEETVYATGAIPEIFQDYPKADRLLQEFLTSGGGVVR